MMSPVAKFVLSLILALLLASGGALRAWAADGDMTALVICGAEGPETVWVDADGTPTAPGRPCTDPCALCILCGATVVPLGVDLPIPALRCESADRSADPVLTTWRRVIPAVARGPPLPEVPA